MQNKIKFIKKIFILITFQFLLIQNVNSITIEGFDIQGNDRVSDQTVIMFSSLKIGDEINDNILNEALKKLYYTDYFKQVEISLDNEIVNIKLTENPIIQSVIIEGIEVDSLVKKINEVTKKIEKY